MSKIETKQQGEVTPRKTQDLTPFEEMDRLFHQFLKKNMMNPFDLHWPEWTHMRRMEQQLPKVDVIERDETVLIKAEIPGIEKDDIDITITEDAVTIKGEIKEEKEDKGEIYRSEIRRESFVRTLLLPCAVNGEKAKANFNNGMLEITVPKTEQVKKVSVEVK